MMAPFDNIVGAFAVAFIIAEAGGATYFLPRRYNRKPFAIKHNPTSNGFANGSNISVLRLRCGHVEDVDNVIGHEEEDPAESQYIEQPIKKELGADTDIVLTTVAKEAVKDDEGGGRSHDFIAKNSSSIVAEYPDNSIKRGVRTNTKPSQGSWEEEIRRTQDFYNSPRSASSSADKILISKNAPENDKDYDDEEIATDGCDLRVSSNGQTISDHSMSENEEAETYSSADVFPENTIDEIVCESIDESISMNSESDPQSIADGFPAPIGSRKFDNDSTDGVPATHSAGKLKDEKFGVPESVDPSDRKDERIVLPNNETTDLKLPPSEEKSVGQEELVGSRTSNNMGAEIKYGMVDESEALSAPEDGDSSDEEELISGQEELQPVASDIEESHLSVKTPDPEISSSHGIETEKEDLLEIPRWQKATTATASNKLVEEGLRRLRRRDGDEPSIPYVITRAMKQVLIDELGYDPLEVDVMRPDVAVIIVGESLKRPDLDVLPSRFYNEIEPAITKNDLRDEKSAQGFCVSLFHRVRKGFSTAQSTVIVIASLGVALALLRPVPDEEKVWEDKTPTLDFPSSLGVVTNTAERELSVLDEDLSESDESPPDKSEQPPNDLDKTWFDKFISFVSKPFETL